MPSISRAYRVLLVSAALACFAALALPACGGGTSEQGGSYAASARENYEKGMQALKDESFDDAERYFRFVKAKYPFSRFAVLADLRLADSSFLHEDYIEAIDAYRQFAKFHPTHEYVTNGYVDYKIGEAYVKQIPDDWFLVPPSFERDETATLDAERQLSGLLDKYPESEYDPKARDLLKQVHQLLAAHELYVARFYLKRGKLRGATFRLETLLTRYDDSSLAPTAGITLGQTYLELGEPWNARHAFQLVLDKHPTDGSARQARTELQALDKRYGTGGPPAPAHQDLPPLTPSPRPEAPPEPTPSEPSGS